MNAAQECSIVMARGTCSALIDSGLIPSTAGPMSMYKLF